MKRIVFFLFLSLCSFSIHAATIADVQFDESITLPDVDQPLVLNGLGIRYKFFFKIYIAALYLSKKSQQPATIVTDPGPKRIVMHFLYDDVPARKLVDAWNEGFANNLSATQFEKLKPRIERFNAQFESVTTGDVVTLDYMPGEGTLVTIKGHRKTVIPGADFNAALLDIWLGKDPVDEELKEALLGLSDD